MPQRPRQHQLETESRTCFQSAIPSRWVYRALDQDYGIDAEVEIFDDSSLATGYKFLVQLKATDEQDIRKGLRLRLPLSKMKYYSSLNLPVLIVKYHSPSGRLFSRWFHSLDPYYTKRGENAITFHFDPDDVWKDTTPKRIVADVEAYRHLKSSHFPRPLHISISLKENEIHKVPAYVIHSRLRELGRQVKHLLLLDICEISSNEILVTNKKIVVKIAGACTLTLHTRQGYTIGDANSSLHFDIMIAIGLAIAYEGHIIEAAEIVSTFLIDSNLTQIPEIVMQLSLILSKANKMHAAFEVAEELFKEDKSVYLAQLLIFPHLVNSRNAGPEKHFVLEILKQIAGEIEKRGDLASAGMLRYNIANSLRAMARWREAVREYRNAAKLDPLYLKRQYYWQELAGVLFENGRYKLSAKLYGISLSLEERVHTRLLYADALMFSGEYLQAITAFEKGLNSDEKQCAAEWHLKLFAISWLRETLKLDRQNRKTPQFTNTFQHRKLQDSVIEKTYLEYLKSDALYPLAWFNVGLVRYRQDDLTNAAMCFLLAALIEPGDMESWKNAFGLALQIQNSNLAGWILQAAYEKHGEAVIQAVAEHFPDNREDIYMLFSQTFEKTSIPDTKILRIHQKEGKWHEIEIGE